MVELGGLGLLVQAHPHLVADSVIAGEHHGQGVESRLHFGARSAQMHEPLVDPRRSLGGLARQQLAEQRLALPGIENTLQSAGDGGGARVDSPSLDHVGPGPNSLIVSRV